MTLTTEIMTYANLERLGDTQPSHSAIPAHIPAALGTFEPQNRQSTNISSTLVVGGMAAM